MLCDWRGWLRVAGFIVAPAVNRTIAAIKAVVAAIGFPAFVIVSVETQIQVQLQSLRALVTAVGQPFQIEAG